jgi:DNA-binding SARP family transcriptional activator/tetratricopeptide (TPR) repeat protein
MNVHGEYVDVGATKVRGLLGVLAYKNHEPVPAGYLADALWDDDHPPKPDKTVQVYVSRLRAALARTGFAGEIVREHDTYRLAMDSSLVDYRRFRTLASAGRRARGRGEHADAAESFTAAVDLWRGPAIADLRTSWARRVQESLVSTELLPVCCDLFDTKLALGEHEFVLDGLRPLLADHPHDERLAGLWIRALTAADRSSEVPAFFREFSRRLDLETNTPPTAELVRIQRNSIRSSTDVLENQRTPVRIPGPPRETPHFTGRTELLARLDELLIGPNATASVVALDGRPGVGKTALVRHWARSHSDDFPGGMLHMDLSGYADTSPVEPGTVMGTFLQELGVPAASREVGADQRAALLRRTLTGQRVLVVLDNVRDGAHVRPLLAATANCPVVITSRRRLTSIVVRDGAECLTVPELAANEATALLEKRIGARVSAEPDAVGELVELCERLPLAVRIAAEHVAARPGVPIGDLVDELRQARLLDAGAHGDEDTTTLRLAFSWSYRALPAEHARMFRMIGLLPGTRFSTSAVAAVGGIDHAAVAGILDALVGAHLVEQEGAGRFRTHDLLRQYAADSARDEPVGQRERAIRRMLAWYVESARNARRLLTADPHDVPALPAGLLDTVEPAAFGSEQDARRWFTLERAGAVACARLAAELGEHEVTWRLAACLNVVNDHGDLRELLEVQRLGYRSAGLAGRRHAEAGCLTSMGVLYGKLDENMRAGRCFEQAYHAFQAAGDRLGEAVSLHNIGCVHLQLGEPVTAIGWHRRALAAFAAEHNEFAMAKVHRWLGDDYRALDRYEQASSHYLEAQYMSQKISDLHGLGETLNRLARLNLDVGRPDQAVRSGLAGLHIHDRTGDRGSAADVLRILATARLELKEYAEAIANATEAAHTHGEMRNTAAQAVALELLAQAHEKAGERPEAQRAWAAAAALLAPTDAPRAESLVDRANTPPPQIPPPRSEFPTTRHPANPATPTEEPTTTEAESDSQTRKTLGPDFG